MKSDESNLERRRQNFPERNDKTEKNKKLHTTPERVKEES